MLIYRCCIKQVLRSFLLFLLLLTIIGCNTPKRNSLNIVDNVKTPSTEFALAELKKSLKNSNYYLDEESDFTISIKLSESLVKQAYAFEQSEDSLLTILAGDRIGAMYGIFDLAEQLSFQIPIDEIKETSSTPFIKKRGVKINIPLDARLPSYDDTGDAAQLNLKEMWNINFWKEYIDELARNRYNVISLWSKHPFPSLIKLENYPEVALNDVYAYANEITPEMNKDWHGIDLFDTANLKLVKTISIEEKIAFWQGVMKYGHDRGIDFLLFTWNIYMGNADKLYGIEPQSDEAIIYMRETVKTFVNTYPHLSGFGVTAGEQMGATVGKRTNVQWLSETYGKGVADALRDTPERDFRFIFRRHHSNLADIDKDFRPYFPGKVETSFKYSMAHMYSSPKPKLIEAYSKDLQKYGYECWLNLRNDDIFNFRWGNPDYVKDYLTTMMNYPVPGFYIGSDGYVWGREFTSKISMLSGELEVKKHWYREMLWGRIAYNPNLDEMFFKNKLKIRFQGINTDHLYLAWKNASEIFPLVTNFHWQPTDAMWAVEGCMSDRGFATVRDFVDCFTMDDDKLMNILDFVDATLNNKEIERITPFELADSLIEYSQVSIEYISKLRKQNRAASAELKASLNDIESMALLGYYYGKKIYGATNLHLYESDTNINTKDAYKLAAIENLMAAAEYWKQLTTITDSQYKPQLLARTKHLDWVATIENVNEDIHIAENSTGTIPKVAKFFFANHNLQNICDPLLKIRFEEQGYQIKHVPWWELDGNATGLRIVILEQGDLVYNFFKSKGGELSADFLKNGYSVVLLGDSYWVILDNEKYAIQAINNLFSKLKEED